jgi:hypothetical protein
MNYEENVGKKVIKINSKPFKSDRTINTVKTVIEHAMLRTPAYTFEEDNSIVECRKCIVIDQMQIGDADAKT